MLNPNWHHSYSLPSRPCRAGLAATLVLSLLAFEPRAEVVDITPNIAVDVGNWTTTTVDKLDIRLNGFTGYKTTGAFGQVIVDYEEYKSGKVLHAQHIVRLPDAVGADGQMHAYFAITHSGDQDGFGADGYWMVAEIDAEDYDEVNDRITQDTNPNDGNSTEGRYVYEEHFTEDGVFSPNCTPTPCIKDGIWYSAAGDWNHPAAMARVGDVLLMVGQNWITTFIDSGDSPDAILFYDVSDPKSPQYIGKLDACDLNLVPVCVPGDFGLGRDEIDNLGLAYFEGEGTGDPDYYHLSVGRNTFTNFYCSEGLDCFKPPDTGNWMDKWQQGASTGAAGGQQGTIIHSREIYSEAPIPGEPCYKADGTLLQAGEFDAFCAPPGKPRAIFSFAAHSEGSRYVQGSCWPYTGGCSVETKDTPYPPFLGFLTDLHDFRKDAGIPLFDERHYVYTNPNNPSDVGTVLSPDPGSLEWKRGNRARNKVYFSQLTGECQGNSAGYVDTNGEVIIYCVAESNFLYDCGNDECNPIYQNRANSPPSFGVIKITDVNGNSVTYRGRGIADLDVLSKPPWGPGHFSNGSAKGVDWKNALRQPTTTIQSLYGEWHLFPAAEFAGDKVSVAQPRLSPYAVTDPGFGSFRVVPEHGIALYEGSKPSGSEKFTGRMVSAIRSVPTLVRYCGADDESCRALPAQDCGDGNFLGTYFEPCVFPRTFADKTSSFIVKNSAWNIYADEFFASSRFTTIDGTIRTEWSGANGVFSSGRSLKKLSPVSCARPLQPAGPFEVSFPYGDSRPLLSWPSVANASAYDIVVERDDGAIMLNDVRNDCDTCLAEPTKYFMPATNTLEVGETYSWRVRAVNKQEACYEAGPYSEPQSITIVGPAVQLSITQTTADPRGLGSGTIEFEAGSDAPASDRGDNYYNPGSVVILRATASEDSEFVTWAGAAASCGTAVTCQFTISTNLNVQAVFRPKPRLYRETGGRGTVAVNPSGVECVNTSGYDCDAYATGTQVTLTAAPDPTSTTFGRWTGDADCSDDDDADGNPLTSRVTLSETKSCTAIFDPTHYVLEVTTSGGGTVSGSDSSGAITCDPQGQVCTKTYAVAAGEQTVTLSATPDTGFRFVRWYGDAACWSSANGEGRNNPIDVTVGSTDVSCRAQFVDENGVFTLNVQKQGAGAGASKVTAIVTAPTPGDLPDIDCPLPACTTEVPATATIQLTATPVRGARFDGWGGSSPLCEGTGSDPVITVDMVDAAILLGDLSCRANFSAKILLIDGSANGSTTGPRVNYGQVFNTLPDVDYDEWSVRNPGAGGVVNSVREEPTAADLAPYSRVIWFSADASTAVSFSPAAGPSPEAETALGEYLDGGGCLMLSSPEYFADRGGLTSFAQSYFGVSAISTDVSAVTQVSGAGLLQGFSGLSTSTLDYGTATNANLDSSLSDAVIADIDPDTNALLQYDDGTLAGVGRDNGVYRTAFLGFPFLALPSGTARIEVMGTFLDYCLQIEKDDEFEANDDGEAGNIRSNIDDERATRLQGDVNLADLKILPGNDDWYRWETSVKADTRFEILFSHNSGDLNFDLYEGNRRDPIETIQSTDDNEFRNFFTVPETSGGATNYYFLRVYGVDGASNSYTLRISSGWVDLDDDGVSNYDDIDDDGDGMSDDFENLYGFDPLLADDAYEDADGDGFTNLDEALGGSNPQDSASVPTAAPVEPAGFFSLPEVCDPLDTSGCTPVVLPWLDLLLGD